MPKGRHAKKWNRLSAVSNEAEQKPTYVPVEPNGSHIVGVLAAAGYESVQ